jgi:nucleoside-triphosphatase THEP1
MLCSDIPKNGWIQLGRFFFDPEGFRFGEDLLTHLHENACPVVTDEFGPLELSGKGWRNSIDRLIVKKDLILMMSVRKEILAAVIDVFTGHELHVFDVNKSTHAALANEIAKLLPS